MLGINVVVAFNVIFPDWRLMALLIVIFIAMECLKIESMLYLFACLSFDVV